MQNNFFEKFVCHCNQVQQLPPKSAFVNDFIAEESPNNVLDWFRQREPQVQILNFLDSNGLLPLR